MPGYNLFVQQMLTECLLQARNCFLDAILRVNKIDKNGLFLDYILDNQNFFSYFFFVPKTSPDEECIVYFLNLLSRIGGGGFFQQEKNLLKSESKSAEKLL